MKTISILGATAVALGAFAAHGLKPVLTDIQLDTFKTGNFYQFIHVIGMLGIFALDASSKTLKRTFNLWLLGIIFFSGSLYLLSIKELIGGNDWRILGPVTPIGGLLFVLGWANLFLYKK